MQRAVSGLCLCLFASTSVRAAPELAPAVRVPLPFASLKAGAAADAFLLPQLPSLPEELDRALLACLNVGCLKGACRRGLDLHESGKACQGLLHDPKKLRVLLVGLEVYGEFIFGLLGLLSFLSGPLLRLATSAEPAPSANRRWWR